MTISLAYGDGVSDYTSLILNEVGNLRANPVSILQEQGEGMITAYSSGRLELGPGVFRVSSDALNFSQDLGLCIKGQGSRRTNNSVRAATTLLMCGTSSGYGIKTYGAGGRGLTFEDLDLCYEDQNFTGDLIDSFSSPGLTFTRCFLGTFGITSATRQRSARSLLRTTYDEFMSLNDCVFDGSQVGWWPDNSRGAFGFGGSMTQFNNSVFYDIADTPIKMSGASRQRYGLQLNNVSLNPITLAGVRGLDIANVNGLTINGGICVGSVGHVPSTEWMRILNCTGYLRGMFFAEGAVAGSISGNISIENNVIEGKNGYNGFNLLSGLISAHGNKFINAGRYAFETPASPSSPLVLDIGPNSYGAWACPLNIPASSPNISGRYVRAASMDSTWAGVINSDPNVSVFNI